jgi:signal transduction histidine kinase/sugar phosphate isomerase/epimerase
MKVGFETVLFGRIVDDWPGKLRMIREAGFLGVEIAQSPEMLRLSGVGDYNILRSMLVDADLHLIGLAGGALKKRLEWVGNAEMPDYFYVDEWHQDEYRQAMKAGAVLALHPHLFLQIDTIADALKVLREHPPHEWPNLKLLPDTAHLHMTGDDPLEILKKHAHRIAAIHLKDWLPQFGRYSHRYARGFVEPGKGIVGVKKICESLSTIYPLPDWLVVEVDSTRTTYGETLNLCSRWVENTLPGVIQKKQPAKFPPATSVSDPVPTESRAPVIDRDKQLEFRTRLAEASQRSSRSFYEEVAAAFGQLVPSHLVQIWIYTPGEDRLNLKGYFRPEGGTAYLGCTLLECTEANGRAPVCQRVIAEPVAQAFDLTHPETRANFRDTRLLASLDALEGSWMISVPVCNTWNAHHLRFVVNLFPDAKQKEVENWLAADKREQFLLELGRLAEALSYSADSMLNERCIVATGAVHHSAPLDLDPQKYYNFLVHEISKHLEAEGVALFLPNEQFKRLDCVASAPGPTKWRENLAKAERHYFFDKDKERKVVIAYLDQEMSYFDAAQTNGKHKSEEPVAAPGEHQCMYFPIVSSRMRKAVGVVRCRNRRETLKVVEHGEFPKCGMFTDDEAAMLDTLFQAACPTLEMLSQQREKIWALGRLNHELDAPVATILASVDMMRTALENKNIKVRDLFGRDYVEDIYQWAQIQYRLLQNAETFRLSFEDRRLLECEETDLYTQVVAPVVTQMAYRFRLKGIKHVPISNHLNGMKPLWVDRNWMQLIFFNLLTNAWKYGGDPKQLHISLDWRMDRSYLVLRCSNQGIGVDEKYAQDIFRPGFRDPEASHHDVSGLGLGLATVLAIAQAHGGTARLAKGRFPTIFEVVLPASLLHQPPNGAPTHRTLRH